MAVFESSVDKFDAGIPRGKFGASRWGADLVSSHNSAKSDGGFASQCISKVYLEFQRPAQMRHSSAVRGGRGTEVVAFLATAAPEARQWLPKVYPRRAWISKSYLADLLPTSEMSGRPVVNLARTAKEAFRE
jgi:hypothetical protein